MSGEVLQSIKQDFSPMLWDDLSPDQRRSVAVQLDYQHDFATEHDRKFWWDFFIRMDGIETAIAT